MMHGIAALWGMLMAVGFSTVAMRYEHAVQKDPRARSAMLGFALAGLVLPFFASVLYYAATGQLDTVESVFKRWVLVLGPVMSAAVGLVVVIGPAAVISASTKRKVS